MNKLKELSLIMKVKNKFEIEQGIDDKDLIKFTIHLVKESQSVDDFIKKYEEMGSEFTLTFMREIFELINKELDQKKAEPVQKFSALAIPNVNEIELDLDFDTKDVLENKRLRSRSNSPEIKHKSLIIGDKYKAVVKKVFEWGAYVKIVGVKGDPEGRIHISKISRKVLTNCKAVLNEGDKVEVVVDNIDGNKVELSMRDFQVKEMGIEKNSRFGTITGIPLRNRKSNNKRILSSPEVWEMKQMKYGKVTSGVDIEVDNELICSEDENEEKVEVELRDEEPPFLRGQTIKSGIKYSPVKIVKIPEGSLHRSAMEQMEFAKERKIRKEEREKIDKEVKAAQQKNEMKIKKQLKMGKKSVTIEEQKKNLPIYNMRDELVDMFRKNRITVVIGETGSGKTTQITQYLIEEGFGATGRIGCTQPRRVAAISVARRVSEEIGCKVGGFVGYSIRFEDCSSPETKIKYMTDGMLLREALIDKNLSAYSVIMLDEAHERTIHTDILLGLLKETMKVREDLRLIVTSATLDAEKFSAFFSNCPILRIPGRVYPVKVFYSKEPEADYLESSISTVMQIHLTEPKGDILVFLSGQEEIDTACQALQERIEKFGKEIPDLIILPCYSAMPSEKQTLIFEPAPEGARKCVVATNIAETSLTIDGIYYVIDAGFCKIKAFNPKLGMDSLMVAPISQSSAEQRKGRAGRTGPGKCYRLYTYEAFMNEMNTTTIPEIQRTNLSNTVLMLKAMGINNLLEFEFMDRPSNQSLIAAMEQLYNLGALDKEGLLTKLGKRMSEFPLEPQMSKMLLTSVDLICSDEVITIVSMLSVPSIFYRPRDKAQLADQKKAQFHHPEGDHLTLLTIYQAWKENNRSSNWCFENFIQARSLRKAEEVRKQLIAILDRYKLPLLSCRYDLASVRKSILAGYFCNVAKKNAKDGYFTMLDNTNVFIHPSSSMFNKSPEWVLYHELVMTSKEYMREVSVIDPIWLIDVAPNFFKMNDPTILDEKKLNEKLRPIFNKHEEPNQWRVGKRKGLIF